jgi:hypothetical protein
VEVETRVLPDYFKGLGIEVSKSRSIKLCADHIHLLLYKPHLEEKDLMATNKSRLLSLIACPQDANSICSTPPVLKNSCSESEAQGIDF